MKWVPCSPTEADHGMCAGAILQPSPTPATGPNDRCHPVARFPRTMAGPLTEPVVPRFGWIRTARRIGTGPYGATCSGRDPNSSTPRGLVDRPDSLLPHANGAAASGKPPVTRDSGHRVNAEHAPSTTATHTPTGWRAGRGSGRARPCTTGSSSPGTRPTGSDPSSTHAACSAPSPPLAVMSLSAIAVDPAAPPARLPVGVGHNCDSAASGSSVSRHSGYQPDTRWLLWTTRSSAVDV